LRTEQHFVERSELIESPRVDRPMEKARVQEHRRDEPPELVTDEHPANDRPERFQHLTVDVAGQNVAIRSKPRTAEEHLEDEDDGDHNQQRHRHRRFASHDFVSMTAEARRIRMWARRGKSSLICMNIAAPNGRMRRYLPSSAASAIARATFSGLMARISRDAPGILPRSAFTKNSVSTVPGQTMATRTPRLSTSSRSVSENPITANFVAQYPPIRGDRILGD